MRRQKNYKLPSLRTKLRRAKQITNYKQYSITKSQSTKRVVLERQIFATVRYFDILDMPVTTTQIWRCLIVGAGAGPAWRRNKQRVALREVRLCLANSTWLGERLGQCWGYYFVKRDGREGQAYVRSRLARHVTSQHKWKLTKRAVKVLARVPLVRMLGVTGSLALYNARASSDLDLFVVARAKRIWTTRLLLLAAAQLLGRRRKHWDTKAPDKVCLNHYVTEAGLTMVPAIHSIYTAVLYAQLVPVYNLTGYLAWRRANNSWLKNWLTWPSGPQLPGRFYVRLGRAERAVKKLLERILLEPIGDFIEGWCEKTQRWAIERHSRMRQGRPFGERAQMPGRIFLAKTELAFHPDSKEPAIVAAFQQDPGQAPLWK